MTRYELLDRIGVGGMAEIFHGRALAAGGFEKPVAIKRILPHLCQDQRFVELLIAEAKVLSLLRHRNIVQIFDVGLGDDGQYFLVMEFVSGMDLGRLQVALETKRRILPVDLGLHIGAEVCEALHHAHTANDPDGKPMRLVHRDISPSNVLISNAGEVKLTDFGIAKRAEEVTGHGTVRGKFAYISPEQARNEHVDPRSDVFSLGIVLFEMLTGRRLFSQLSDLEALRAVRESRIPRPRELDGNLPKAVDELLGKALAREPARRYATAAEFGMALRSLRYSFETSSGDPSSELARVIATADHPTTLPPGAFEPGEATVIRIRTAAAFSLDNARVAFSNARQVIDRFEEEEETRLSKLGPEMLQAMRATGQGSTQDQATRAAKPLNVNKQPAPEYLDEPTSLAEPPVAGLPREHELDEETIARPSPLRGLAPTTLKRLPPPTGPAGTPAPVPARAASLAAPAPPLLMPDAAGWDAPSYSATPSPPAPGVAHQQPLQAEAFPPRQRTAASTSPPVPGPLEGPSSAGGLLAPPVAAYPAFPAAAPFPEHIGPSAVPTLRGHGFDRPRPPPAERDTSSERWRTAALILGAIAMAVLAFAVTRSCMHEEPARPVAAPR